MTPSKLRVLGQMTSEWKLFINFCPKSAFLPRFTCHGQIWRKSAVAKLPISYLVLLTKKTGVRGHFLAPSFAPLCRSRPKFRGRCRPLSCSCAPTLIRIGCGLLDLFRKESKKVNTIRLKAAIRRLSAYNKHLCKLYVQLKISRRKCITKLSKS